MKKNYSLCILTGFFLFAPHQFLFAQVELYPFPKIEDVKTKKGQEKKAAEPFVQALSKKMDVPEELLTKTFAKGFGRTELIRLILISKKSKKTLEELIQEREGGTRLAKIADSARLSNKKIRQEANNLLKELEAEGEKIKKELARSTSSIAGTSDTLTKNGTSYMLRPATDPHEKTGDRIHPE